MAADNEYVVDASVVADQTIYASLQMGSDISLFYHNIRNNSTLSTLNLIGDITMPTTGSPGYKYLQFYGDGTINLVGNYQRGARTTYLVSRCKDLTLAGSNLITRVHIYDNSGVNITGYTKIDNQGYLAIAGYSGGGTFNGTGTLHIEPRATLGVAWLYVMAGSTLPLMFRSSARADYQANSMPLEL
ncbi:MAG: hypothetical protein M0P93_09005 [Candidatus Cloacimonetes bacterium]|nr:hypothetical protein [Candidatus Cloacimonadota bacterium]